MFAFGFGLNAQTLLVEDFAYPAGDSLGAHGWVSFSGSNTNVLSVVSPGLTFTGYIGSGIGNATHVSNTGQDAYKGFDSVTSGSIYAAMMVRIDTGHTGDYFSALLPPTSTTNYTARLYAKDTAGSVAFGISKGAASGGPIVYGNNGYTYGTVYVLVLKYKFNTGTTTDDEISLYVFSAALPLTEPSTPYLGPVLGTVNDATSLGRIALRQGTTASSATLGVDGIRVTKSWSNIVTSVNTISTNVPSGFTLSQNYPNPFNPVTNIRFAIPSNGFVTLKVFNALGKEVSNLVNQNMNAGTFEVKFDGAKLASGMYFYKMSFIADNGKLFADTKKLMLVK